LTPEAKRITRSSKNSTPAEKIPSFDSCVAEALSETKKREVKGK
jgi:hypothetical protein